MLHSEPLEHEEIVLDRGASDSSVFRPHGGKKRKGLSISRAETSSRAEVMSDGRAVSEVRRPIAEDAASCLDATVLVAVTRREWSLNSPMASRFQA